MDSSKSLSQIGPNESFNHLNYNNLLSDTSLKNGKQPKIQFPKNKSLVPNFSLCDQIRMQNAHNFDKGQKEILDAILTNSTPSFQNKDVNISLEEKGLYKII